MGYLATGASTCPIKDCDHIFFIGFMGAGKSTLARTLGTMFGRRYCDTDRLVIARSGTTIREIFEREGEDRFRERETSVLESLALERSLLVSCGGGIIERQENIELMRAMGHVVFLDISVDGALAHITNRSERPLLGKTRAESAALLDRRLPIYRSAAHTIVDINDKSFDEVALEVGGLLVEKGLL